VSGSDSIERAVDAALTESLGRIVVGFSGGLDSTVLLHAARERIVDPARVFALHVDHGINPKSGEWARHCAAVSAAIGVAFVERRVRVAGGGEASARAARFAAFTEVLEPTDDLWLAHHRDDQIETVLWRLLRGGGSAALAGMPRSRAIGRSRLLRPLLDVPRAEIERWAAARGLRWIDDDSNANTDFDRNFLRHAVLPVLRGRWPDVDARLLTAAARVADDAAALREMLDRRLDAVMIDGGLPIAALADGDARALARRWLERRGVFGVRDRALGELIRQARSAVDRAPVVQVSAQRMVRRHEGVLHLTDAIRYPIAPTRWMLEEPLYYGTGVLSALRGPNGLRRDLRCVEVRPRDGGERMRPAGRAGSRTVKRLLHEARVAPWLRERYPLVFVDGALAAVPGIAVDTAFAERGDDGWSVRFEPNR
jgi:tRNA(Ile)-lysidine synthase